MFAACLLVLRFVAPELDTEKSNIKNSENTALFLISCFQYIFSGIVLSVGPPFRQTMRNNRKSRPDAHDSHLMLTLFSAFRGHRCSDVSDCGIHAI